MRRLIVNADDFGLTSGINRAIVECCENGIVSSSTLMASSSAFEEAIALARSAEQRGKRFSVGCHIVLVDGEPVSDPAKLPSLLQHDPQHGRARFRDKLSDFAIAAMAGKLKPDEIAAEALAQMRSIESAGVQLSHFDTHKHTHMFPQVLEPLLRAAREAGVPAVRNPFETLFPLPISRILASPDLWTRFVEMSVLRGFARNFRQLVTSYGLRTTDGSLGLLVTGVLDLDLFTSIVDSLPEGTWEFVCHPGYNDAELGRVHTRLRDSRTQELQVLKSLEAKEALQRRGFELISYHEL